VAKKWKPIGTKNLIIEVDDKILEQRLAELAELFYDAFCELHLNRSVEPANINNFCFSKDEQEFKKAG
jgi:hypothetical protein